MRLHASSVEGKHRLAVGSAPAAPGPAIYLVSTRDVPGMDLCRPEPRIARRVWMYAGTGPCHDSSGSRTWPVSSFPLCFERCGVLPGSGFRHDRGGRTGGALPSGRARLSLTVLACRATRLPCSESVKPQVRLPDVQAGEGAADDQALDLGGALEDREDLRVPVPALDREIARVAVTAEHLDGLLGHPHRGLPRDQLGHGPLGVIERDALARHPRGP